MRIFYIWNTAESAGRVLCRIAGDGKEYIMQDKQRTRVRMLLLIAAVMLLVLGTIRGEVSVVFTKAVNICMECIGIG